jgi:hypothetical protein
MGHDDHRTRRVALILLSLISVVLLTSYLIVYFGRKFSWFGLDIEMLYKEMNDGKITNDSILTFKIESNNCTLLGKYAGPDYRLIESVGSGESCKKYVYKAGDEPTKYTKQLIDRDLMNDGIVRQ